MFTSEVPGSGFGDDGYKIYKSPTEVGTDFGTDSMAYAMANKIFSQQPNILANNGYLVIIPYVVEVQGITFDGTPDAGGFKLVFDGTSCPVIPYNATSSIVQTSLRSIPGLEDVTVVGSITASTSLAVTFKGVYGSAPLLNVSANTLMNGSISVVPTVAQITEGESLAEAILRTVGLVQYFGVLATQIFLDEDIQDAADVIQPLNKIFGYVTTDEGSVEDGGIIFELTQQSLYKSRGFLYLDTDDSALGFLAAFFGRYLSTNFSGSNTTQDMHLKTLIGVEPDPGMTQNILEKCAIAGADIYASFQGIPKVFESGANQFSDQAYNQGWFVGALEIAYFNVLATVSTKVTQTEDGMDNIKSSLRKVCRQAVRNGYFAPGVWTRPETFGVQQDFLANIEQYAFYVYTSPIAEQSVAERESRTAPLAQIAGKEAGAINKGNVIIYINK